MSTFRRNLTSSTMNMWLELCSLVDAVSLSEEVDQIQWNFASSGKYAVQSLYAVIIHGRVKICTFYLAYYSSFKSSVF